MSFLVVGNLNIETTAKVASFPLDYTPTAYTPFGVSSRVSAVGYNLSKALVTLGEDVTLASIIGRDLAATNIRAVLAADGIDDQFVLAQVEQTPQSVVLYDSAGARHIRTDLKDVLDQSYPLTQFEQAAAGCDVVVLTNIAYTRPLLSSADRAKQAHCHRPSHPQRLRRLLQPSLLRSCQYPVYEWRETSDSAGGVGSPGVAALPR